MPDRRAREERAQEEGPRGERKRRAREESSLATRMHERSLECLPAHLPAQIHPPIAPPRFCPST